MKASEMIELVGSEVTWEILNADGTWYVCAMHHSGDPETSYKCQEASEVLDDCVRAVANDVLAWQKDQGWPVTGQGEL